MPEIVPIRDLKNTAKISDLCRSTNAPVFVAKNGYGDLVIMSMQCYEQALAKAEIYKKLEEAERDVDQARVAEADASLTKIRTRYRV